jgi:GH15 family glucan-1,4-alpha-glucosidase
MFPPIADYCFLSDCESMALVAPDGAVEWLCLPRPDGPSVFGALLDRNAGFMRFGPAELRVPNQRRYVPGTNALETTWHTQTGWLTVTDLLVMQPTPPGPRRVEYRRVPGDVTAQGTLLRIATCTDGHVDLMVDCLPLFDYGRSESRWAPANDGDTQAVVTNGDLELLLTSSMRVECTGPRAHGHTTLHPGDTAFVALSWGLDPAPATVEAALTCWRQTQKYWRDWLGNAEIPDHRFRPYIERSALALKGLSYAPTGAVLAAATTSLPETVGGERNWDYRYSWIRDSSFMLRALHGLKLNWEAFEYFEFVIDAMRRSGDDTAFDMQIMFGIGGERDLTEHTLDHLSGYKNSRPVRIGNGAYDQRQNDVWGMVLDSIAIHMRHGGQIGPNAWLVLATLVDDAIAASAEPDLGIGEMRGPPRFFVASKVMCWVAIDRGVLLARERGDDERETRWQAAADALKAEICERGLDKRNVFVQHYDTTELVASALLIPLMGFLPPDDERVRATVLAIADELTEDGLVLRYRLDQTDDGLANEPEGTFTICSFWLVSALALIGEVDRARVLFEKLLSFAGPLLLYAEEIDAPTGLHLGNFPQAFTHLALIDAAQRLIECEDHAQ